MGLGELQAPHSSLGKLGKGQHCQTPESKAQCWAWKGGQAGREHHSGPKETPVLVWEAAPSGILLGPSLTDIMSLGKSYPLSHLSFPICGERGISSSWF